MKCLICKNGETQPGYAVVTLQRQGNTLIIKDVPAEICENCGEYYLSGEVAAHLYKQAEKSILHGAEVEIGHYAIA
jgi:YgiT-type zinc finger domain-containing protein